MHGFYFRLNNLVDTLNGVLYQCTVDIIKVSISGSLEVKNHVGTMKDPEERGLETIQTTAISARLAFSFKPSQSTSFTKFHKLQMLLLKKPHFSMIFLYLEAPLTQLSNTVELVCTFGSRLTEAQNILDYRYCQVLYSATLLRLGWHIVGDDKQIDTILRLVLLFPQS